VQGVIGAASIHVTSTDTNDVCMGEDAFGVSISSLLGKLSFVVLQGFDLCAQTNTTLKVCF
jgi:hypothetical protein